MAKLDKKRNTGCPIAFALDVFGDRWSLIIIRDMLLKGYKTYSQFLESEESFATNVLSNRLKELEADGIITKQKDPQNRRQNIYELTPKGADLAPTLLEMVRWSSRYDANTVTPKNVVKRIKSDKEGFISDLVGYALNK